MPATNSHFTHLKALFRFKEKREASRKSDTRRRIRSARKELRKIVGTSVEAVNYINNNIYDEELINFSQRAFIRGDQKINVEAIVWLHRLYKFHQNLATMILSMSRLARSQSTENSGVKELNEYVKQRVSLRTYFEDRVKVIGQINGIIDCDPNITPQSLELYEQIFEEQGMINEAEASLLATMGEVDEEDVEDWFIQKRLKCDMLVPELTHQWRENEFDRQLNWRCQKPLL